MQYLRDSSKPTHAVVQGIERVLRRSLTQPRNLPDAPSVPDTRPLLLRPGLLSVVRSRTPIDCHRSERTTARARPTDPAGRSRRHDGSIATALLNGTHVASTSGGVGPGGLGSMALGTFTPRQDSPAAIQKHTLPAAGPSPKSRRGRGGMVSVAPRRYRHVRYRTGCTASLHGLRVVDTASQPRKQLIESRISERMLSPTRIPPLAALPATRGQQGRRTS